MPMFDFKCDNPECEYSRVPKTEFLSPAEYEEKKKNYPCNCGGKLKRSWGGGNVKFNLKGGGYYCNTHS